MSDIKERQSSDSKQGGEGTRSLHQKGWSPETKNIGTPPGNTQAPEPADDTGTK
jgi:hypothetical protein